MKKPAKTSIKGKGTAVSKPDFNYGEFATIRSQAGLDNFTFEIP
jgi:hypothetical protein